MALSIKDPEADRLARELAAKTGETITEAVVKALRERLKREGTRTPVSLKDEIMAISRRAAARGDHRLRRPRPAALMVVDTSVIAAILFGEPEAAEFAAAIDRDRTRLMSAASALEASLVVQSELGEEGSRDLDLLLLTSGEPLLFKGGDFSKTDVAVWK